MNPDQWEKVSRVYHAALARREEEREVFLSDACAGDHALRMEVEALLACDPAAERFLDSPAMEVAARMQQGSSAEDSLVGRQIGVYRITSRLGAGGMGEVYRAHDTKLNREVAFKVLPDLFAADPHRLKRFQREAQALAALNHPSIAHIHGFEEADGVQALVMELVDGPELEALIARGPMPIKDVLSIARQIAEALEEAHQHGIIHRDLKPANIKVRDDGTVKVLDFGLAKAFDPRSASSAANVPTHDASATEMGLILGTAHYMAPEQAMGKPIDKRVDVWAFGVVLFEMLTGRRAFDGEDVSGIVAAVLKDTPSWALLPSETPSSIRRLLHRCLEKDRRERLGDMSAVRLDIKDALAGEPTSAGAKLPSALGTGQRLAWAAALLTITVLSGLLAISYFRTPPERPEVRLPISTPSTTEAFSFALSPDGRRLAFVADDAGESRLWVQRLDTGRAEPLAGTEEATYPFWSPDSQSIAFFASGWLKRLDLGSGLPRQLTSVFAPRGGSWSAHGVIVFAPTVLDPLWQIPESGGSPTRVTRLQGLDQAHLFPQFLPDGRRFLFYASGNPNDQGIHLGSLDSEKTTRLTAAETAGAYLAPGWLLFVLDGALVARRFDASRGELSGEPVTVATPVGFGRARWRIFDGGGHGDLPGERRRARETTADLVRPAQATALGTIGAADWTGLEWPALSPDGRRVAVGRRVQGNRDVWILDGVRNWPLTFDGSNDTGPIWSPDGQWIVFSSNRKGTFRPVSETVGRCRQRGTALGVSVPQETPPTGRTTTGSCIPSTTIRRRAMTSGRCRWSEEWRRKK